MFYRVHRHGIPEFNADNAYSSPWGMEYCPHCDGEGYIPWEDDRECPHCHGTGEPPRQRGYSCCESSEDLVSYFESRGGCDDDVPVVIFSGEVVGTGEDGEPLVVPKSFPKPRWTTYKQIAKHFKKEV